MNRRKVRKIMQRFQANMPEPESELVYASSYELLVAVMLSAQATDVSVNKATQKLFPVANTPQGIIALGVEGLKPYLKTINLYPTKSRNLVKMSEILLEQYEGEVPRTREALQTLPGVGRKTANVVLNAAFGQPVMAVDTHIFRVSNRTGIAPGKNVTEVEEKLVQIIPEAFLLDAHHWLLLHGRYTCMARTPKCGNCLISDLCEYPEKTAA
ncbi:endonuclease III [Oxalobacter vibrioformis]|uniref:Endonuclease III n=1 Tax=Oxalobacter vibrioformis TaxID=933080 RepID=A0A9E9P4X2_9BURK|nr:endonuclease III [Oxalobacter vibrioformis]WAW10546.1 endonuclease III [Oxalobacter vibrioformis]